MHAFTITLVAALAGAAAAVPMDQASYGDSQKRGSYTNGQISFFTQQGAYGSCGELHSDKDHVVAISYKLQGSTFPPPYCGSKIKVTHEGAEHDGDNTKDRTVEVVVVDTCTTCDDSELELSVAAYEALTGKKWDEPADIKRIQWNFV